MPLMCHFFYFKDSAGPAATISHLFSSLVELVKGMTEELFSLSLQNSASALAQAQDVFAAQVTEFGAMFPQILTADDKEFQQILVSPLLYLIRSCEVCCNLDLTQLILFLFHRTRLRKASKLHSQSRGLSLKKRLRPRQELRTFLMHSRLSVKYSPTPSRLFA